MKIMFVLSRVPWPLEKGDKLRAFHFIKELSLKHEVILFCLSDEAVNPQAEQKLKEYCKEVFIFRLSKWAIFWRLFQAIFNRLPFQVNYFHSQKAQTAFDRFIETHLPDHVFVQLVRMAAYVKRYEIFNKSIDYMDALGSGMQRMANNAFPPIKWLMQLEAKRLLDYEKSTYSLFNSHFVISQNDAEQLNLPDNATCTVVGNGIGSSYFEAFTINQPKKWTVLFTGNMNYRPNVESAKFLVREVMPLVWEKHPQAKVCLAGATPAKAVQSLQSERVTVTGWVDDLKLKYHDSHMFVAPMLINSGLQNKLLEAMACKLPCVTTTLANKALQAKSGEEILVGDTAKEIANAVLQILHNPEFGVSLAQHGHEYVKGRFNWHAASDLIEQQIVPAN